MRAKELEFPDYYGKNWDALLGCLTDLSWFKHKEVIIILKDADCLLNLDHFILTNLIEILATAVRDTHKETNQAQKFIDEPLLTVVMDIQSTTTLDTINNIVKKANE